MAYLFGLCHKVKCTMLYVLQDIRYTVGTVQVDVTLPFTYECLVTLRLEKLPCADQVLYHTDVRTRLDIASKNPPTFSPGISSSDLYLVSGTGPW